MLSLLRYELRSRWGAVLGWGIGLGLFGLYIIALYPQFAPQLAGFDVSNIDAYRMFGDFTDFTTFPGFVAAEMFTFVPLMLAIYAIVNATGTLAGEEDSGTLELLLAMPLPRWKLLLTKALALGIAVALILALVGLGMVAGYEGVKDEVDTMGVGPARLMTATLGLWPLVMFFASLSFFLGAYLPNRRSAAALAGLALAVSYFGNNLASFSEPLEALKPLFAFNYFNSSAALREGLAAGDLLALAGASLFFLGLALLSFQRRNVTVSAWPWQRPRVA